MATLTGFTRPSDPIEENSLATKVSTDIGIPVTVKVLPNDIHVTGAISESNRTAIQASMTSYFYSFFQFGAPMVDNPDMSTDRHNTGITEHAAYWADNTVLGLAQRKSYVSGSLKLNSFIYSTKTTTISGVATFYITDNGLSSGSAVFANVYADTIAVTPYGSSGSFQPFSPVVSGDKKSITISVNQIVSVLGLLTLQTAANGVDCRLYVIGD